MVQQSAGMVVSIIVPSLNEQEDIFKRCIESLLDQEGITPHIILSTVEGDPSIKWGLEYDNVEVIYMNRDDHPGRSPDGSFQQIVNAIPYLRGEYMFYFSSNDICQKSKGINEINKLVDGKLVCYSSILFCDENLENVREKTYPEEYTVDRHLASNFIYDSSMVRTEIFKKYMPFSGWYNCGYWDLWLRIYEGEGNVFAYNPEPTKMYIQHSNSMHLKREKSQADKERHLADREEMLSYHKQILYGDTNNGV